MGLSDIWAKGQTLVAAIGAVLLALTIGKFFGKREGKKQEHVRQVEESYEITETLNEVNNENRERESEDRQNLEDRLASGDLPDID